MLRNLLISLIWKSPPETKNYGNGMHRLPLCIQDLERFCSSPTANILRNQTLYKIISIDNHNNLYYIMTIWSYDLEVIQVTQDDLLSII